MELFGTDGVRGVANEKLTPTLVTRLCEAASYVLKADFEKDKKSKTGSDAPKSLRRRAIVGRDTRISGEFLSASVDAGLASAGIDVIDVGVLPTPGIAYLSQTLNVELGVIISASHNPYLDNGIKFFTHSGFKLADELEEQIEERLKTPFIDRPIRDEVGHISFDNQNAVTAYCNHLCDCVRKTINTEKPLQGMRIAIDPANGAASVVAPRVFQQLGADIVVINANPDGTNINAGCGSTHPEQLQSLVVSVGADLGVAYDGDADRCLAVDHEGNLINGDQIMAIFAKDMKERNILKKDTLVATIMSNKGLDIALEKEGIKIVKTKVGDRYVLEEMLKSGYNIGGEQSGHVINLDNATTGDGILTSLTLSGCVKRSGKSLKELASIVHILPQQLINVPNVEKEKADTDEIVLERVKLANEKLGETGRVVLRPSGTEPLVRVMVEAKTQEEADKIAKELADVVKQRLSL